MNPPPNLNTILLHGGEYKDIKEAQTILQNDGLVALPTETVYGLAANAYKEQAVGKIFAAKNRPHNNPLIVHVHTFEQALSLFSIDTFSSLSKRRLEKLMAHFWPGPLTLVAKKSLTNPFLSGEMATIAVRMPDHPICLQVMKDLAFPLVMPSANISTRPSPTTAEHVMATMRGRIDAVLDGGPTNIGIESSVLLVDKETPVLLRPGMVSQSALQDCLSEHISALTHDSHAPLSPGVAHLHYRPRVCSVSRAHVEDKTSWHEANVFLISQSDAQAMSLQFGQKRLGRFITLGDDAASFAKNLYAAFYQCEAWPTLPVKIVLPALITDDWQGIIDRINRACELQLGV